MQDSERSRVGGAMGFVLFMFWLHGPGPVLRAIGDHFHALADGLRPPVILTGKQVGALIELELSRLKEDMEET